MGSVETSVPCFETSHICLLVFMCVCSHVKEKDYMIKAFILNFEAEVSTGIYTAKNEKRKTKESMLLHSHDG